MPAFETEKNGDPNVIWTTSSNGNKCDRMRMMYYSVMTQTNSEKEFPSAPIRSRTFDLPITSLDALPLSYRRLVEAKAIKLGPWDKQLLTGPLGVSVSEFACAITE